MDSSYIMPFIESTQNVFNTMLRLPVEVGEPGRKAAGQPSHDVSGIIGMSGTVDGTVALSFDTEAAEQIVAQFIGFRLDHTHEDFADAVGELVNMIAGGAKARFQSGDVSISCPSVVVGKEHLVFTRKDAVHIALPCRCEFGAFAVEVCMRNGASTPSPGAVAAEARA